MKIGQLRAKLLPSKSPYPLTDTATKISRGYRDRTGVWVVVDTLSSSRVPLPFPVDMLSQFGHTRYASRHEWGTHTKKNPNPLQPFHTKTVVDSFKIVRFTIRNHRWKAENPFYPKIRENFMHANCLTLKFAEFSCRENFLFYSIFSHIDYCNALLYGLPNYQIAKLQHIQNMAAKLIFQQPKFSRVTPLLAQLHWLPVEQRIIFKILILTFKGVHKSAPGYICDMFLVKSPTHSCRSCTSIADI